MQILRYSLARLIHAIPVLLGVTIFVFLTIHLVPGDPIRIMMHGRIDDAAGCGNLPPARHGPAAGHPVPAIFCATR